MAIIGAERAMAETEIIFSIRESPEGGYEARALGHSIFTQADTFAKLKANLQEAVRCHFDANAVCTLALIHEL
jgi:hypothetical protein